MFKKIKRLCAEVVYCIISRSSSLIFLIAALFIVGNFYLLSTSFKKSKEDIPVEVNDVKQDGDKLFEQKFEDYLKEGYDEVVDLPVDDKKHKSYDEVVDFPVDDKKHTDNILNVDDIFHERLEPLHPTVKQPHIFAETDKVYKLAVVSEKKNTTKQLKPAVMALLVISCNRPSVGRCLDRIFKYKPTDVDIPIIVSQDCGHEATANVIRSYGSNVTHIKQPNLGDVANVPSNMKRYMGYYKISRHFKFALGKVFSEWDVGSVVIVEDDIDIAPDFFDYFLATRPLLDQDKSIFCVSAWNDNGKGDSIDETAVDLLYRSDFFPGLGWLITRDVWNELGPKWPLGFWDDWMRAPEQRKERVCIRPEISRTKTFGRIGVSLGQFYDQYLKYIKLNNQPFPFRDYDMSYLTKEKYDNSFIQTVYASQEKNANDIENLKMNSEEPVRITYNSNGELEMLTRKFGLMKDLKAGVPRTGYKGIVTFYRNGRRIYISPSKNWVGYQEQN